MTPTQRRALLIAGGIVAVAAVVIAVLVLPGGDDDGDDVATVTSTSLETTTTVRPTTIPLQPVTTPPPGETTTTTGIATTAAPAPVVDGQGAVLARPATASTRTRPQGSGCASLGMTGYSVRCGEVEDGSDTFAWLVERHNVTGGIRVSVLREAGEDRFTVVLEALDDGPAGPARFSAVGVRSQDLSADGTPEFVFGFRNQGSGAILDVDVVDAPGRVVVHRSLDKGRAEVSDGRLDVWAAEFGPNDASCCPSRYRHGLIRRTEGAWRLVSSTLEPPGAVPEGDFA